MVTMDADHVVTAVFEPVKVYTVTTKVTNDLDKPLGSITLSPNDHAGKYEEGTQITVTANDGSGTRASCTISVPVRVTGVSLNYNDFSLTVGSTKKIVAKIEPSDATNQSVTWTSSNPGVATVSNGTVTAKKKGTATITVKTSDGGKTASVKVTVVEKIVNVTGVSISPSSLNLDVNKTGQLTANITPTGATNKNVTWHSSDTHIATVSQNGVVKGLASGEVTITVKTEDGGKTDSITVKVYENGNVDNKLDHLDITSGAATIYLANNLSTDIIIRNFYINKTT